MHIQITRIERPAKLFDNSSISLQNGMNWSFDLKLLRSPKHRQFIVGIGTHDGQGHLAHTLKRTSYVQGSQLPAKRLAMRPRGADKQHVRAFIHCREVRRIALRGPAPSTLNTPKLSRDRGVPIPVRVHGMWHQ